MNHCGIPVREISCSTLRSRVSYLYHTLRLCGGPVVHSPVVWCSCGPCETLCSACRDIKLGQILIQAGFFLLSYSYRGEGIPRYS